MLDTGASITIFTPDTAESLKLKKIAKINISDSFISKDTDLVVAEKIILGDVSVEKCSAAILETDKFEDTFNIKIDGVLGSNFLRFFAIRIDYSRKTITFAATSKDFSTELEPSHKIALSQSKTGSIYLLLRISGVEVPYRAEIDTGADSSILIPMQHLERLKPALNTEVLRCQGILTRSIFSESDGLISRLGEFKIGEQSIENSLVRFDNREINSLLIGNKFLSRFIVTIDYLKNEMFLMPIAGKAYETNIKSFGFGTKQNEDTKLYITSLYEGSDAERAGLRIGDVILRVEAKGEFGTSYEEFTKISSKYNTIHLYVQRDGGEEEIVLTKSWLFPEVEQEVHRKSL